MNGERDDRERRAPLSFSPSGIPSDRSSGARVLLDFLFSFHIGALSFCIAVYALQRRDSHARH